MANWPAVPREKYPAREEVLSVVTLGFIGCLEMSFKALFER